MVVIGWKSGENRARSGEAWQSLIASWKRDGAMQRDWNLRLGGRRVETRACA